MASQSLALTKIAASTWEATLNKARQVYTAVVRPAMTYGAPISHTPKEPNRKSVGPIAKLVTLQNKCLRSITGAYKATNTKVLEAESGVVQLDLHLNQADLRSRNTPQRREVVKLAKARIRQKLQGKRGRKYRSGATPMVIKDIGQRKNRRSCKTRRDWHKQATHLSKKWVWQK